MFERSSGILMHISSLPSEYGIGDFGKKAYEFVDFLKKSEQKLWQVLPMGPTGYGDSPYQSFSTYAGNPYFIDIEDLYQLGYLDRDDLDYMREINYSDNLAYEQLYERKTKVLKKAFEGFKKENREDIVEEFKKFKKENSWWLDNYSLYMSLKFKFNGKSWQDWSKDYKYRNVKKMLIDEEIKKNIDYFSFVQYTFYKQWFKLKEYANSNGIKIIGDIPIFVATDSADTWSNSDIFQFDKYKRPKRVAGCPPDYFSKDGQLWGNVLYDWKKLKESGYQWWVKRIEYSFKIYDIVRIDHFRGFEAYWSISAKDKTAVKGHWEKGPGIEFFRVLERKIGKKSIIAEDLGLLTDGVRKLLKRSEFPGMKILESKPKIGYTYIGKDETEKVKDIMGPPITVDTNLSVYETIINIFSKDVGTIFLTDNDQLVGVVSRKDLLKIAIGKTDIDKIPINVIMTRMPNIIYVEENDSVLDSVKKLIAHQIDSLPVVRAEEKNGIKFLKIVGRLTKTNITKLFMEFLSK